MWDFIARGKGRGGRKGENEKGGGKRSEKGKGEGKKGAGKKGSEEKDEEVGLSQKPRKEIEISMRPRMPLKRPPDGWFLRRAMAGPIMGHMNVMLWWGDQDEPLVFHVLELHWP